MDVIDTSDCRQKCSIETSDLGLDFINAIRPVRYKYKCPRTVKDEDGNIVFEGSENDVSKSKTYQYGLISKNNKFLKVWVKLHL